MTEIADWIHWGKVKVLTRPAPFGGLEENPLPWLFRLLEAIYIPCLVAPSLIFNARSVALSPLNFHLYLSL